jgi:integrase
LNEIARFLSFLDSGLKEHNISIHLHENASSDLINHYINNVCIIEQERSYNAVQKTKAAIEAYYNYLAKNGLCESKDIYIYPSLVSTARENTNKRNAIKYIPKLTRTIMSRYCKSHLERLILRTGAELGLRSKENLGLLLDDFTYQNKRCLGLRSLIAKANEQASKDVFEYHLSAKWTKHREDTGGTSRTLYIHRRLLNDIDEYITAYKDKKDGRPESSLSTLFLQDEGPQKGQRIPMNKGTSVFRAVREKVLSVYGNTIALSSDNTYHHLRHSFGTDLFYDLCDKNYQGLSHESSVMIDVATRLGHKFSSNKKHGGLQSVTRGYIRSCMEKEHLETA